MRTLGWIIIAILAWNAQLAKAETSVPMQGPVPAVADLGVEKLISQDELATLWTYQDRSNTIRQQLMTDMQLTTTGRDAKVAADRQMTKTVDDTSTHIARKLVLGGFWLDTARRNTFLDFDVFLVIQHSNDTEMRRITLTQTEPLVAKGLFNGESYGLMYDRLAQIDGRPQRFGSQTSCVDGHFQVYPLEDPAKVDAWRKQYGFRQTFADIQTQHAGQTCINPPVKPKP